MAKRQRREARTRDSLHTWFCLWCGERFECRNANAKTCSGRCRVNLSKFVRATGLQVIDPPGRVTAGAAIAALVRELLARERVRRAQESALAALPSHMRPPGF
jgi:hypothetical protein